MIAVDSAVLDEILSRLRSIEQTVSARQVPPQPSQPHRLLNAKEVRDLVRCKRQRVTDAIASGALPAETRPGRGNGVVHMIRSEDALQWAMSLSRRSATAPTHSNGSSP